MNASSFRGRVVSGLCICCLFVVSPEVFSKEPKAKVKTGKAKAGTPYTSSKGSFAVTVPPGNWAVNTYAFKESQLKNEEYDYEEVVFYIADFGQAYGAGVRRIPESVLVEMRNEDEKQSLSRLAIKALYQWREDFPEEPEVVEEAPVETQFGEGLLRIYLAKRSSLIGVSVVSGGGSGRAGIPPPERFDTHVAVQVVKKGDRFIYATVEDDDLQQASARGLHGGPPFDPKPDLTKKLQSFFASLSVRM
jgi:hypothetical protein